MNAGILHLSFLQKELRCGQRLLCYVPHIVMNYFFLYSLLL